MINWNCLKDDYIAGVKRATQDHEEHQEDGDHEEHEDMEEVEQGQGPEHEQELNAKVLYDVSGAMTSHGRFAIGYGAVRAADVRAAAKENNVTQSNPVSMQMLARQNAELRRENTRLQKENDSVTQQGKVAIDLTVVCICDESIFLQANHFSKSEIFDVFTRHFIDALDSDMKFQRHPYDLHQQQQRKEL
jgi:hypothetical protein